VTGEAVDLFAFDVGYNIIRTRVGSILGRMPHALDIRRDHTLPRDVVLHHPLALNPNFPSSPRPAGLSAAALTAVVG